MTAVVASTPLQVFTKSRSPCHMSRDWYVRAGPAYKRNAKFECVFGVQFCEFRAADLCGHFRINELFERGQTFFQLGAINGSFVEIPAGNLVEICVTDEKIICSTLNGLGKRAPNHVRYQFSQVENRKIGIRNPDVVSLIVYINFVQGIAFARYLLIYTYNELGDGDDVCLFACPEECSCRVSASSAGRGFRTFVRTLLQYR